jgi:multiple sugar transport system permease protein
MRDIGQARRRRGRAPRRNPKGRALSLRGFVEGLDRIADTAFGRSPAHAAKSRRRRWVQLTTSCSKVTMATAFDRMAETAARATPPDLARRMRGLSDTAIAWLFITPTIVLLLAINIFPLIWTIQLSFTNYRANRPNAAIKNVGLDNYTTILSNADIWAAMQATAHFVFWTILLQTLIGFTLAWLIDRKFRGHAFWTTVILIPMMLSPAVVGNFWRFLYQPQIGLFNYIVSFFTGLPPSSFEMTGTVALAPWSIIIVDTWMWTPYVMLICLAGLRSIPDYIYEAAEVDRASKWRQFWSITLPMALPFIMLAVLFRGIENFKMFDMVNLLTGGGPGSTTEVASITLKREAFEKWRTGFSSAFAIILFVTVFGLANIYVKALNRVKQR